MWNSITPDELESASFSTSFRGYSTDEVDAFLQSAAEGMRMALKEITERAYERLGEDVGGLLQHAKDVADEMIKKAEEQANTLRADAERDTARARREADSDARETRAHAERNASERTAQADGEVRRLQGIEGETRERITALRLQLTAVADQLDRLGAAQTEPEVKIEPEAHEVTQ
ncbi:MAG: DivIVA domain-containing protein [Actinomycetota bacterium]